MSLMLMPGRPMFPSIGLEPRSRDVPCAHRGFTLLELLIALLIFSIGALAIAQLQINGMRFTTNASDRLRAVWLAESMADRMRANRIGVTEGFYDQATGAGDCAGSALPTGTGAALTSQCTPQELARFHIQEWNQEITRIMGAGSGGVVCRDGTPNDGVQGSWECSGGADSRYAIKVGWVEAALQSEGGRGTARAEENQAIRLVFSWPRRINLAAGGGTGGT